MAIRQVSWQVDDLKDSSKAARLLELCDQAKEQGRKLIVFSFFCTTLRKVTELMRDRCMEPITGSITPQRRQEIVDEFTKAADGAVLVYRLLADDAIDEQIMELLKKSSFSLTALLTNPLWAKSL